MTLREVAQNIESFGREVADYFKVFFETIATKNILDWKLSYFFVIGLVLFIIFAFISSFVDEMKIKARQNRITKQKIREMQARPPDPEE